MEFFNVMSGVFGRWGLWGLFLNSFLASFFVVPPPDFLLIAMNFAQPNKAVFYAFVTTVASVLGGVVGYMIGKFIGRPAFNWFFKFFKSKHADSKAQENFEKIEKLYDQYGSWAVLFGSFTPFPYKLFTVASGILNMNLTKFVLVSILGRGGRFFIVSFVLLVFGEGIKENLNFVIISTSIVIVLFFIILYKKRHHIIKKD